LAYQNRAFAWNGKKDYDRAIADCDQAIRLNPNDALAFQNRGCAWNGKRDYGRAIADFTQAIKLDPNYALAYQNLAWLQATCPDARFRSGYKALENGRRANELDGRRDANDIDTLAAAAAENSYFESARQWEAEAIKLLTNEKDKQDFGSRLKLYEQKKPYRQES
jgi:tetratricopeptide (TPR) repeat protein